MNRLRIWWRSAQAAARIARGGRGKCFGRLWWWDGWRLRSIRSWPRIPFHVLVRRVIWLCRDEMIENIEANNALLAYLRGHDGRCP